MKIYLLDVSPLYNSAVFEKYYALCPDYRKRKIDRLSGGNDRCLSLGAEILLAHGMSEAGFPSYSISLSESGKPFSKDCDIQFNLSHSGKYATAAFSNSCIGIDIETPRKINPNLSRRCFSAEENELVRSSETCDVDFLGIWTRKESLLKAAGTGICGALSEICVIDNKVYFNGKLYTISTEVCDDYVLSVATCGSITSVLPEHVVIT